MEVEVPGRTQRKQSTVRAGKEMKWVKNRSKHHGEHLGEQREEHLVPYSAGAQAKERPARHPK